MSRKREVTGCGQDAKHLAALQERKRALAGKLRRLERERAVETGPMEREIARLQTRLKQTRLRLTAPIDETVLAIQDLDREIARHQPEGGQTTIERKPDVARHHDPFSAGTFPLSVGHHH